MMVLQHWDLYTIQNSHKTVDFRKEKDDLTLTCPGASIQHLHFFIWSIRLFHQVQLWITHSNMWSWNSACFNFTGTQFSQQEFEILTTNLVIRGKHWNITFYRHHCISIASGTLQISRLAKWSGKKILIMQLRVKANLLHLLLNKKRRKNI